MCLINTVLNILVKYCGYVAFLKVSTSKYGNKDNFTWTYVKEKDKFNMSFPTLWCRNNNNNLFHRFW